jgi:hypothetical protein
VCEVHLTFNSRHTSGGLARQLRATTGLMQCSNQQNTELINGFVCRQFVRNSYQRSVMNFVIQLT